MSFDNIKSVLIMMCDELGSDKKSKPLIEKIDSALDDDEMKEGLREGVKRLRELDKNALADDIEKKTKGFAF